MPKKHFLSDKFPVWRDSSLGEKYAWPLSSYGPEPGGKQLVGVEN
jgi:hypothetical protein